MKTREELRNGIAGALYEETFGPWSPMNRRIAFAVLRADLKEPWLAKADAVLAMLDSNGLVVCPLTITREMAAQAGEGPLNWPRKVAELAIAASPFAAPKQQEE